MILTPLVMATDCDILSLKVISFNMHGFHQGCTVVDDLIDEIKPDVFCYKNIG